MKYSKGITCSDGVNRNQHYFSLESLIKMYSESWDCPVPVGFNHDSSIFLGIGLLSGIYLEPGKAYVTNEVAFADTQDEVDELLCARTAWSQKVFIDSRKEQIEELRNELGNSLSECFKVVPTVTAVAVDDPGIVLRVSPIIRELMDKDGLIPIDQLEVIIPGVYKFKGFALFAHRYFRRNCNIANSLNNEFLDLFHKIHDTIPNLNQRIRIDLNMIGLAQNVHQEFEYSYSWGPKFNDDLLTIPLGVTKHDNTENGIYRYMSSTEFGWYIQDHHQTLEIEELVEHDNICSGDDRLYGCRYVHSYVDNESELPAHLDGAIRAYAEAKLLDRLDISLKQASRDTVYTKLWRVDGPIPVQVWKSLITHFYRDNYLVGEYLGGKDEMLDSFKCQEYAENSDDQTTLEDFIPVNLNANDGLRIFFKYDKPIPDLHKNVTIFTYESIIMPAVTRPVPVVDSETISVIKLIKRKGCTVAFPQVELVAHEDTVNNFPVFVCDSAKSANLVLHSMLIWCQALSKMGNDQLISFSIKYNYDQEKSVFLSFAGHIIDICNVINDINIEFTNSDITDWVCALYRANNKFKCADLHPNISDVSTHSNILCFRRNVVPPEYIKNVRMEDEALTCDLIMPTSEMKIMQKLNVKIAPNYLIKQSICEKCKKEYKLCSCVKFIDNAREHVNKFNFLSFTWTNRHASL